MSFRPVKKIFISYRREDSPGEAGRLYEDLLPTFGASRVFMDVAGIPGGANFKTAISDNLAGAGVLLAVIGPHWATVTDAQGMRRLENTSDFVRQEIASALSRGLPVIPVLVNRATMPTADELPVDLKGLADRQGDELTLARWRSDFGVLLTHVEQYVPANPKQEERRWGRWIGVGALGVLTLLALTIYGFSNRTPVAQPTVQPQSATTAETPAKQAGVKSFAAPVPVVKSAARAVDADDAPTSGARARESVEETPVAVVPAARTPSVMGRWRKTGYPDEESPLEFTVSPSPQGLYVQVLGMCGSAQCSWGSRGLSFDGVEGVAGSWPMRNSGDGMEVQRSVSMTLRPALHTMHVTLARSWRDLRRGAQSSDQELQYTRVSGE